MGGMDCVNMKNSFNFEPIQEIGYVPVTKLNDAKDRKYINNGSLI